MSERTALGNGSAMSDTRPLIPIFIGEGYEFWSIRMKTLLRSQDLWDFVERGYEDPDDDEVRLKENRKKDAKALVIIQQAVHDSIFSRIASATTSKQAWSVLQKEYQGDSKVKVVRLQSLRREFETLLMKNVDRSYGEIICDQTIVEKVLRSLNPKFDHVVAAIEESKDLSNFSFDELMGSLQAHEVRINRTVEQTEEKAFQVKDIPSRDGETSTFRGEEEAVLVGVDVEGEEDEVSRLFMAHSVDSHQSKSLWFLDSGCSNHMTPSKHIFQDIDETNKLTVQLGNDKEVKVEGKGTIKILIAQGKYKFLDDVQYVPELGYNLLSVGQLISSGYSLLFDDGKCTIMDKKSGQVLMHVSMTKNKMFRLMFQR
ncbi:hypothetical protein K2173_001737 [Erythroxylum novogranatense]|uniref:Retrovirus-related Pol polyprotein from transposon TNT 1-94-like beta-barrel domain-containing protein n=1 Tax=Erythroxylum novogranatense TaxID=1862640 RepID=A0AAV8S826_9ROSI|nr:hypothetical protein K2173_001737 [Erythroxylum novogranatense]